MPLEQLINANNSLQNLGNAPAGSVNALGNLSIENPTVEQVNAGIQQGAAIVSERESEAAFGEHLREAAGVVRRMFR